MRLRHSLALLALLCSGTAAAHGPQAHAAADGPPASVATIMNKVLPDYPGKEALMITVEFPPGGTDQIHRHDAHAFVYVLEGSIVMGVNGDKEVTLTPGQGFYEGPNDIHTVGRNASKDKPAKFLVVLLKDIGKPVSLPVK
ncbi:MAG: cupin domain-containing protein [Lysobacter sp.]